MSRTEIQKRIRKIREERETRVQAAPVASPVPVPRKKPVPPVEAKPLVVYECCARIQRVRSWFYPSHLRCAECRREIRGQVVDETRSV